MVPSISVSGNISAWVSPNNSNYNLTQGSQVGLYNTLSNSTLASPYNANGSVKYVISMPLDQQWVYTKQVVDSLKNNLWLSQQKGYATYNSAYGGSYRHTRGSGPGIVASMWV